MSDLEECPIRNWENHRSEPILHQHARDKTFQVYCESCLLTTGFYDDAESARKRWTELSKNPIDIEDYRNLPFEERFPDHKNGSMKDLK